jgi:hypothetical protein
MPATRGGPHDTTAIRGGVIWRSWSGREGWNRKRNHDRRSRWVTSPRAPQAGEILLSPPGEFQLLQLALRQLRNS